MKPDQEQKQPVKVQILKQMPLALAGQGYKLYRLFGALCLIKTLWPDSPFYDSNASHTDMAALSGESIDSMERRIAPLVELGWLRPRQALQKSYDPISWEDLASAYKIKHEQKYEVPMVPGIKLHKVIREKAIHEKLKQCDRAARMKVKTNPVLKEVLPAVTNCKDENTHAFTQRVAHHQLVCFKTEGINYTEDEAYALNTYYIKAQSQFRADTALNYRSWSKLFGYKSRGGIAKDMRSLVRLGLITKQHRVEPMPGHVKGEYYTHQGFARFNHEHQHMELVMPDLVTVLPMAGLQQRFERMKLQGQINPPPPPNQLISDRVRRGHETRKRRENEAKLAA